MGKTGKEMSAMERYWHNQKQRNKDKGKEKKSFGRDRDNRKRDDNSKGNDDKSHKNPYMNMNNNIYNKPQDDKSKKPFDDSRGSKYPPSATNDKEKAPNLRRDLFSNQQPKYEKSNTKISFQGNEISLDQLVKREKWAAKNAKGEEERMKKYKQYSDDEDENFIPPLPLEENKLGKYADIYYECAKEIDREYIEDHTYIIDVIRKQAQRSKRESEKEDDLKAKFDDQYKKLEKVTVDNRGKIDKKGNIRELESHDPFMKTLLDEKYDITKKLKIQKEDVKNPDITNKQDSLLTNIDKVKEAAGIPDKEKSEGSPKKIPNPEITVKEQEIVQEKPKEIVESRYFTPKPLTGVIIAEAEFYDKEAINLKKEVPNFVPLAVQKKIRAQNDEKEILIVKQHIEQKFNIKDELTQPNHNNVPKTEVQMNSNKKVFNEYGDEDISKKNDLVILQDDSDKDDEDFESDED